MKRTKYITSIAILIFSFLFLVGAAFAEGESIFAQTYSNTPESAGLYIGAVSEVNKTDNSIILPKDIKDIYDKSASTSSTKTITVKNGTAQLVLTVTDEGYNKLIAAAKQIYDKESLRIKVGQMGADFDVQADTAQAGVMLSGIRPIVSLVIGLLAYAVVIGMSLFTALDIVYITMPVFRNKCEEMKQSGSGVMTKTDHKTGETKLRWVTDEAQYAVTTCTIESGKNPLGVYFKKRVIAYVLIAIVIYILLTGNIQMIVNIAINLVSGVLDALSTLGN